jgi:hypothetical protein
MMSKMYDISEKTAATFISSKTLLYRTGISRATLNNYIRLEIISPPIVRKPDDPASKARQIGYFRDTVLDTLERIKQYKKEGRAMKEIVSLLHLKNDDLLEGPEVEVPAGDRQTENMERPGAEGREMDRGNMPSNGEGIARGEANSDSIAETGDLPFSHHELFEIRLPILISFSVLVGKLQDAVRICAELPSEEYSVLIHQIWQCMEDSFRRYDGLHAKHTRDGMHLYFQKECDSKYLLNTLLCAIDIRTRLKKLKDEWKMKKGWINELCLNIGISEGEEYFATIPGSLTEFTPVGDPERYASHLSELGHFGSIWTTKDLLNRLTEEEKKKIRYGIRHQRPEQCLLIENTFSRIMDLIPQDHSNAFQFQDIATLPVTEIFSLR